MPGKKDNDDSQQKRRIQPRRNKPNPRYTHQQEENIVDTSSGAIMLTNFFKKANQTYREYSQRSKQQQRNRYQQNQRPSMKFDEFNRVTAEKKTIKNIDDLYEDIKQNNHQKQSDRREYSEHDQQKSKKNIKKTKKIQKLPKKKGKISPKKIIEANINKKMDQPPKNIEIEAEQNHNNQQVLINQHQDQMDIGSQINREENIRIYNPINLEPENNQIEEENESESNQQNEENREDLVLRHPNTNKQLPVIPSIRVIYYIHASQCYWKKKRMQRQRNPDQLP